MVLASLASLASSACASFHELAASGDAGGAGGKDSATDVAVPHDATTHEADVRTPEASADVAQPPSDFACTKAWSSPPGSGDPRCEGIRTVSLVATGTVTVGGVSIALTSAARLGIAYDTIAPVDAQGVQVATFVVPTTAAAPLMPTLVGIGFGEQSHAGQAHAIAASGAADVLHVVYVDEDEDEVLYRQIVAGGATATATELVATGVGAGSYVSLAASATGTVRAVYYVPSFGAVRSAARNAGGGFATPSEIVTGLVAGAPGVGQSALTFDDQETPNVLFQSCPTAGFSTPTWVTFSGSWSLEKTIDNNVLNGFAGYSPSIVVSNATKYASYFFVAANQTFQPTAELHVASWQLASDTPTVSIVDNAIPASDPAEDAGAVDFRFSAALAVDGFGLLHMVVVRPDAMNQIASVEYVRQTQSSGGSITWLTDTIDENALGTDLTATAPNAFAAIVVDAAARPHIAYRSGKDGNVYYATRFDR